MRKAAVQPTSRRWEVNVWVKEVYRLEVEADTEDEAEDFARDTYDTKDLFDANIEAVIATEIEPEIQTLYLQPDPKDPTVIGHYPIKIDASVYDPVPEVTMRLAVFTDGKGQRWAEIDGEWYAVDNHDAIRLRKRDDTNMENKNNG